MNLSKNNIFSTLVLIVVMVLLVIVQGTSQAAISYPGPATMTLTPSSGSYPVGSTFTVTIHENSYANEVAVVEADLAYNPSQLQFISSVASSELSSGLMQNSGNNGLTCFVGSKMGAPFLTGNHAVATITFKVLAAGTSNITFVKGPNACSQVSEGSEILSVANSQNIWNGVASAGSFTLTNSSVAPTTKPSVTSSIPATNSTTTAPKTTTTPKTTTATVKSTAPMTNSSNPNIQQAVQGATSAGSLITVKVVDSNNKIMVGVKVTLNNSLTSISDNSGYAFFKNVPAGRHTVKAIVNGKETSQIIDVKGVSTEAQSFSIKPASKATTNSNIKYAVVVFAILTVLLISYFLLRKLRKPKDPHFIGAPIISGSMKADSSSVPPQAENTQTSDGPPVAGTVITPNTTPKQTDVDKEPINDQPQ